MNATSKRIICYLAITFLLTYGVEIGIIYPCLTSNDLNLALLGQLLTAGVMFLPALGVLLTRLLTKEGFRNSYFLPKAGKHSIPYFLMGWFGPALLTALGAVLYFVIFPQDFDPAMGYVATALQASILNPKQELVTITAISQLVMGVFLAPLLNCLTCFGEEWGWRGYLLPKMQEKLPLLPMLLVNGIIWGLWHAPLTVMGHNYRTGYWGYPITGILAMCVFCIVMGILFSYLTIRTGSCLPAAFAHGSLNGMAAAGVLFTRDGNYNPFIGPVPTGIIGGMFFLIAAIAVILLLRKDKKQAGGS